MSEIRMKSPDGGFTHAYSNSEQVYLEKLGWKVEAVKVIETDEQQEKVVEKRKPGRPAKG